MKPERCPVWWNLPVEALLDLIGDVSGRLDLDEFRAGLLGALVRAVPSDWVSLNDLGPDPGDSTVLIEPPFPPEDHELFASLAEENPLIAHYQRTLDGRAYRFSDLVTPAELHRLRLYREFYARIGLEHQIAFTLPPRPGRLLGVALSRRARDFTDSEQKLLNDARPFLIQAYRSAIEHTELLGGSGPGVSHRSATDSLKSALTGARLSAREAAVLALVATGSSDEAAGEALGISPRTVQKHLERCYRKLDVVSRSGAAAVAWALADAADRPGR
jgi:DNA-binding CsgD family transcriptional regulator